MKFLIALLALVVCVCASPISPIHDALFMAADNTRVAIGDAMVRAEDHARAVHDATRTLVETSVNGWGAHPWNVGVLPHHPMIAPSLFY